MADVTAKQILRRVKARITETREDVPDAFDWLTTQIDEIEHEEAFDRAKHVLTAVCWALGYQDIYSIPDANTAHVVTDAAITRTEDG